jgi:lipoprotein signal peptidase
VLTRQREDPIGPVIPEYRMTDDRTAVSAAMARAPLDHAGSGARHRPRLTALALVLVVVLVDQATKWWGWRHAPATYINAGSTWLIGQPVSGWFSGAASGRFLDAAAAVVFSVAGFLLVRRRRAARVRVAGFLIIGGWTSNLLDRLGMHTVTAPGSPRGAVDFIHVGTPYFNLADFIIIGATTVLVVGSCAAAARKFRDAATSARGALGRPWVPVRVCAAGVGLVATVVLSMARPIGSANDPWVDSSPKASAEVITHG